MYKVVTLARLKGVSLGILLRAAVMIFMPLTSLGAGSVSVYWDASTNATVTGYNIYYGTASRNYTGMLNAGSNVSAALSNLANGKTYYIAVTAYDALGNESDFSSEVSYTVPGVADQPPTISSIANKNLSPGQTTGAIAFTVNDPDTSVTSLTVSGSSSNQGLIPNGNIVFGGSGQNRTVTITPAAGQTGTAQITVTVSDGTLTAQTSFSVSVQASQDQPPTISTIASQNTFEGVSSGAIPFTVNDPDNAATSLTVSASSSNQGLIPNANIVFGGSGQNRTVTITPAAGQTGTAQITIAVSDGTLTAQTSFAVNVQVQTAMSKSELPKTSTYNGLFYEQNAVQLRSSGSVKLTVSSAGKYSGSLQMAAGKYSFSGTFGSVCVGTNVVVRKGGTPLYVSFSLQSGGTAGQLVGSLSDGTWTAPMNGAQAVYNSKMRPAPFAGSYTLTVPGEDNSPSFSVGNSFGSLKVDGSGNVKFAGSLADGTKISQSSSLSEDGTWPLFVPLYGGQGMLMGWISFTNRVQDDLHGPVNWIKNPSTIARYYPGGLAIQSDAMGSMFVSSAGNPLTFGVAQLQFGDTGTGLIMSLKVSPKTGVFTGLMFNKMTGKGMPFQGALLQKLSTGYGFLLATNQSTSVVLTK